jgi:hypothetical protein
MTTTTTVTSSVTFTATPSFPRFASKADLAPLRIPDLATLEQDMDTSPLAVPFPRISQRRKLYRGVGTQPWHNKSSSDSDSETEAEATISRAMPIPPPPMASPAIMPGADPKRTYSESQIPTGTILPMLTVYTTPLIRKKSGEVVKSSLKSPSVSSVGSSRGSTMPSTPIFEKSVHFDGQLEHVKLFRKEQKPAAVSREGSPDGSETSENDTPGRQSDNHYRSSDEERLRSTLVLEAVNIPLRNAMASTQERLGDLDVRLEEVKFLPLLWHPPQ